MPIKIITKDINDVLRITHDEREIAKFTEFTLPRITEMVKINGEAAAAELGVAFDVTNPKVIKWIKERAGMLIKSIGDTTLEKLKRTLAEGVANGESIPNLASRISGVYDEAKGSRAIKIARTETLASSNQGNLAAYKQSAVIEKKEWLTAFDERTCEECEAMNGETVNINKNFSCGLDAPPLHPSCRCVILPVIKE